MAAASANNWCRSHITSLCADPKIALGRFRHCGGGVLWKTVLCLPCLDHPFSRLGGKRRIRRGVSNEARHERPEQNPTVARLSTHDIRASCHGFNDQTTAIR